MCLIICLIVYNKRMHETKDRITLNNYRIQTCSTPVTAIDNIYKHSL